MLLETILSESAFEFGNAPLNDFEKDQDGEILLREAASELDETLHDAFITDLSESAKRTSKIVEAVSGGVTLSEATQAEEIVTLSEAAKASFFQSLKDALAKLKAKVSSIIDNVILFVSKYLNENKFMLQADKVITDKSATAKVQGYTYTVNALDSKKAFASMKKIADGKKTSKDFKTEDKDALVAAALPGAKAVTFEKELFKALRNKTDKKAEKTVSYSDASAAVANCNNMKQTLALIKSQLTSAVDAAISDVKNAETKEGEEDVRKQKASLISKAASFASKITAAQIKATKEQLSFNKDVIYAVIKESRKKSKDK